MDLLSNYSEEIRDRIVNAHDFEKTFRARPTVSDDSFYAISQDLASSKPGTVLKVEEETDVSLYTLPSNLALSRFVYQSKTSKGDLIPVSAYVLWPYFARSRKDGLSMVIWVSDLGACCPILLLSKEVLASPTTFPRLGIGIKV